MMDQTPWYGLFLYVRLTKYRIRIGGGIAPAWRLVPVILSCFFTYLSAIVVLIWDSIDQNSSGALHVGRYIINAFTERFIRQWPDCILCIPFILRGSANECWLYICRTCATATWRLGPVEPAMEKADMKLAPLCLFFVTTMVSQSSCQLVVKAFFGWSRSKPILL